MSSALLTTKEEPFDVFKVDPADSGSVDDNDDFFADMPDYSIVDDDDDNFDPPDDAINDGYPPDYTVVEDDTDEAPSSSVAPPVEFTIQDESNNGAKGEEDYTVWKPPPPPPREGKRPPKRKKAVTNMAGTSWMEKNSRFMQEDFEADDEFGGDGSGRTSRRRGGRDIRRGRDGAGKNFRQDFRGTRVFVQNIPPDVSWQDLKDHFRVAGEVVFASVSVDNRTGQSKGHGVVQYETTDMAANAIRIMRDYPLDGAQLYVREDVQERSGPMSSVLPDSKRGPTPPSKWKCADEDALEDLGEGEYRQIRSLIKARDDARRRRNYDAADGMREDLKMKFGVHLDDRLKMWWVSWDGGRSVPQTIADMKGDGRWGKPNEWRQIQTTPENDLCVDPDMVQGLLKQRDIARKEKDFSTADALLEKARTSPDGDLTLRIHDESRTWRVWTEEKPPRRPPREQRDQRDHRDMRSDAAKQCIDLVIKHAPEKREEVAQMLRQFPGREFNILQKLKDKFE